MNRQNKKSNEKNERREVWTWDFHSEGIEDVHNHVKKEKNENNLLSSIILLRDISSIGEITIENLKIKLFLESENKF